METGWKQSFGHFSVTPFAGFAVSHLSSQGFVEDSTNTLGRPGILGLTFGSHSVTSRVSSLGIQLDTRLSLGNGLSLTPFARVAWTHEFNIDRGLNSYLTASPGAAAFVQGAPAGRDGAKVNAGLKLDVGKSVGVFATFDGDFSGHSQSYAGSGGFKISW